MAQRLDRHRPADRGPLARTSRPVREGGDPKTCWCAYWRVRGRTGRDSPREEPQPPARVPSNAGPPPGLVAYRDGRAVGWVSLGPREAFARLGALADPASGSTRCPVWSIVCFVVSRTARGARASPGGSSTPRSTTLGPRRPGRRGVPVDSGGARSSAVNGLYRASCRPSGRMPAGFRVVRRDQFAQATVRRVIVRRDLSS